MSAVWRDDFAGSGIITVNADGIAYTSVESDWARTSGTATCTTINARLVGTIPAQADKERHLAVTWTTNPSSFAATIAFGDITGGNYYKLQVQTGHQYHMYQVVGGIATQKFQGPAVGSGAKDGDRVTISHSAAGALTATLDSPVDGRLDIGTFTDAAFAIGNEVALINGTGGAAIAADDLLVFGTIARPATWIVAGNGTTIGDGTLAHPMTYAGAMTIDTVAQGGDAIKLRAGDHGDTLADAPVEPTINGSPGNPIVIKPYEPDFTTKPNDWPHVHYSTNLVHGSCSYLDFYDIDFGGNDSTRDVTVSPKAVAIHSVGTRLFNCLIHDYAYDGVGFWEDALASIVYGCFIYNNGRYDVPRAIFGGHGFYTQNNGDDTHQIIDNAIFNNYNFAIQAYGSSEAVVKNYLIQGNTAFYQGNPQHGDPSSQSRELFCGGLTLTVTDDVHMDQNTVWCQFGSSSIQMGYNGTNNLAGYVTNNYAVQTLNYSAAAPLTVHYFATLQVSGNTFLQSGADGNVINLLYLAGQGLPVASPWQNNTYLHAGSPAFATDNGIANPSYNTLAAWTAATGYDASGSSLSAMTPLPPQYVSVRPNQYRNAINIPRGMVTVIDWQGGSSAGVDGSTMFVTNDSYAAYHLFDWVQGNPPLITGQYTGASITVPLTTIAPPELIADGTPGTSSWNYGLVTPQAGQPSVFVFVKVPTTITPASTKRGLGWAQ